MVEAEVQNYRYEHGHRYHAHDEGAYFLPNDDNEAIRLGSRLTRSYLHSLYSLTFQIHNTRSGFRLSPTKLS